jgi:hypothetical protein
MADFPEELYTSTPVEKLERIREELDRGESEENTRQVIGDILAEPDKEYSQSDILVRMRHLLEDDVTWGFDAGGNRSRLLQMLREVDNLPRSADATSWPRPPFEYEVVLVEEHYCIFWRENKAILDGDHEVLTFWCGFGEDANKAKHTADILNGKFPAI